MSVTYRCRDTSPMPLRDRRRHIQLFNLGVIALVALLVTGATIGILYQAALRGQRERLTETVHTLDHLFTAVERDESAEHKEAADARGETLAQITEAHSADRGFGRTGEFIIARKSGKWVQFLLPPRGMSSASPPRFRLGSPLAQPMQRALTGHSGTMIGTDYRGHTVLAAYMPVKALKIGLVAKVDLAEVREPFIKAGLASLIIALGLVAVGADIGRRFTDPLFRRIEEDDQRYRALYELSPYGVVLIDPVTAEHLEFNEVAHQQVGYSREEFARLRVADYVMSEDQERVKAHIARVLETGQDDFDSIHRTRDGEPRHIHVHVRAFSLGGRTVLHAIYQDITDRVRTNEELRDHRDNLERRVAARTADLEATNRRLQEEIRERAQAETGLRMANMVYENTIEGIFVTDAHGTILSVNPAFSTITGYSAEEAIGANPRILKSEHQNEQFYATLWDDLLREGRWQGELWNRRKNGEAYLQRLTITMLPDHLGRPQNYVAVIDDITELHEQAQRLHHQAYHDALTGLPNRALFHDRLAQAQAHSRRTGTDLAILLMDLDRFKNINDTLGHDIGDMLLQQVAQRLEESLRADDTISRFGGDEFVALITELSGGHVAERVANKITAAFDRPFRIGNHDLSITTSIGISLFPHDGEDAGTLLRNADTAMYRAKEQGRNHCQFYTADMNAEAVKRLAMENALHRALERDELELHYQPRVSLHSGRIVGMEALLRWNSPELGQVSPAQFIPVAEETGLIIPIGEWVLATACRQTRQWHEEGFKALRVSVNISAHQFTQPDLLGRIDAILAGSGLGGTNLELELTETLIMEHAESSIKTLHALKSRGIYLAIDDFGTGYSSLNYLKRFPIDILKIDQSFVRDITSDPEDAAIAETVIALGHSLHLEVLAEGVETEKQLAFLSERGCDSVQGYYFSRPLPVDAFGRLLEHNGLETGISASGDGAPGHPHGQEYL